MIVVSSFDVEMVTRFETSWQGLRKSFHVCWQSIEEIGDHLQEINKGGLILF